MCGGRLTALIKNKGSKLELCSFATNRDARIATLSSLFSNQD